MAETTMHRQLTIWLIALIAGYCQATTGHMLQIFSPAAGSAQVIHSAPCNTSTKPVFQTEQYHPTGTTLSCIGNILFHELASDLVYWQEPDDKLTVTSQFPAEYCVALPLSGEVLVFNKDITLQQPLKLPLQDSRETSESQTSSEFAQYTDQTKVSSKTPFCFHFVYEREQALNELYLITVTLGHNGEVTIVRHQISSPQWHRLQQAMETSGYTIPELSHDEMLISRQGLHLLELTLIPASDDKHLTKDILLGFYIDQNQHLIWLQPATTNIPEAQKPGFQQPRVQQLGLGKRIKQWCLCQAGVDSVEVSPATDNPDNTQYDARKLPEQEQIIINELSAYFWNLEKQKALAKFMTDRFQAESGITLLSDFMHEINYNDNLVWHAENEEKNVSNMTRLISSFRYKYSTQHPNNYILFFFEKLQQCLNTAKNPARLTLAQLLEKLQQIESEQPRVRLLPSYHPS